MTSAALGLEPSARDSITERANSPMELVLGFSSKGTSEGLRVGTARLSTIFAAERSPPLAFSMTTLMMSGAASLRSLLVC